MSNYCTNCKWLGKESIANHTNWLCKRENSIGYMLQSLCGNPTKLWRCKDECWYETKNKSEVSKLVTEHGRAMQFMVDKMLEQQEKKMTTKEMIKVMQAHEAGKQIQSRQRNTNIEFKDDDAPTFNFFCVEYRIKPEYRPLKPEELIELVGTIVKFKHNRGEENTRFLIISSRANQLVTFSGTYTAQQMFDIFIKLDGTPVGKMEE